MSSNQNGNNDFAPGVKEQQPQLRESSPSENYFVAPITSKSDVPMQDYALAVNNQNDQNEQTQAKRKPIFQRFEIIFFCFLMAGFNLEFGVVLVVTLATIGFLFIVLRKQSLTYSSVMMTGGIALFFFGVLVSSPIFFSPGLHAQLTYWHPRQNPEVFFALSLLCKSVGVIAGVVGFFKILWHFVEKQYARMQIKSDISAEDVIECDCPGNGFFMSWIVFPLSVLWIFETLRCVIFLSHPESQINSIVFVHLIPIILIIRIIGRWFIFHRTIACSASGMTFDREFKKSLPKKLFRAWSDLHSVEFSGALNPEELKTSPILIGCFLTLNFRTSGSVSLDLAKVERSQIVKLLLQIEAHCNHSIFSKQAYLFNQIMLNAASVVVDAENQLDTDKLEMQFSATHFIPLATGTILQSGRYKVVTQIASGGMSSVYAATQSNNNAGKNENNVVIKECVLPLNTDEKTRLKARELFAREAKMLAKLDHPQIVRVLDSFVENEREYIVLEYKVGPTLRQLRQLKGDSIAEFIPDWSYQISQILEYLHSLEPPVIHRDLTPDNLILADDNKIFAIDFGVSNEFLGNATGTLVGKQAYISPEQFRGKSEPRSDIYSFGATMSYLYTGVDPVPLSISDPRQRAENVPPAIADLIVADTQLSPDKRPSAHEMQIQLKKIKDEQKL